MRGRAIRGNANTELPQACIVFDTETRCEKVVSTGAQSHTLMLGTAIYWRCEKGLVRSRCMHTYRTDDGFWTWVRERLSPYRTTWIWAHNLAFDLTITRFWERWEGGIYVDKFHVLDGIPTILAGTLYGCRVVILDTMNWWRKPLKELGEWCGIYKKDMPGDAASESDWADYCMRDSEITEAVVHRTIETVRELDMGCLRYTAAAQALRCWQHRFLYPGTVPPANPSETKLAREAYYGGRTDLWYRGRITTPLRSPEHIPIDGHGSMPNERIGPIRICDMNSMYGSVMADSMLPCRLRDYSDCVSVGDIKDNIGRYGMVASVYVDTKSPLPVRMPDIGTVWAVGKFATVLSGPELLRAWRDGAIRSVDRLATYDMGYVCREYALYWLRKREEFRLSGDKIMEEFAKSMNNSLYGKWGQKAPKWVRDDSFDPDFQWGSGVTTDADTGKLKRFKVTAGVVDIEGEDGETAHSFAALAGYITGHARSRMDECRIVAGKHNTIYQCIDSVHVTDAGWERLVVGNLTHDTLPGKLRCTGRVNDARYYAINAWVGDGRLKVSGLPKQARQIMEGEWEYLEFEQLGSILQRQPDGSVTVREQHWRPDWHYHHGTVTDAGWVEPLSIDGSAD